MPTLPTTSTPEPSFFVAGGTLARNAASYVERKADTDLLQGLLAGRFCYVLTSRQMGKSSLMVRTATRLRQEGVAVAVLDLTAIGQNLTAEQWYDGLLSHVGQQLDIEDELEDFWLEHARVAPLQRFIRALKEVVLRRVPGRVVLFVDEVDAVRSLPFSTDEFFAAIREAYNRRTEDPDLARLAFALCGVAAPSDLIQDTRTTPFNIGQRVELHDFTAAEASVLASGLAAGTAGRQILDRVLYWTGGHPYLTQRLCLAVTETGVAPTVQDVDRCCHELFLSSRSRERDDNLLFVRERLLRSEVDTAGLLDLYAQVRQGRRIRDDDGDRRVTVLRLAGITRVENGLLRVRNRIYAHVFDGAWVQSSMPDAELRRQRHAYRRGVMRATVVAGVVVAALAGLAWVAASNAQRAGERAREADVARGRSDLLVQQREAALAEMKRQRETAVSAQKVAVQKSAQASRLMRDALKQKAIAEKAGERAAAQEAVAVREKARAQQQERVSRRLAAAERDQRSRAERLLYPASIDRASERLSMGDIRGAAALLDRFARPDRPGEDLRGFEWSYLRALCVDGSQRTLRGHAESVNACVYSADGSTLVTADEDGSIRWWDSRTGRTLGTVRHDREPIKHLAVSPDGATLAVGLTSSVAFYDMTSRREAGVLKLEGGGVGSRVLKVAFSPDGRLLAAGAENGFVSFWEVPSRRFLGELPRLHAAPWALAFSPNGRTLFVGLADSYTRTGARVFDVAGRKEIRSLGDGAGGHTYWVVGAAFTPDGKVLATASRDKTIRLWNTANWNLLGVLKDHVHDVKGVAFTPDGKTLLSCSADSTLRVWESGNWLGGQMPRAVATLRGHSRAVNALALSPDGGWIATGGLDETVKIWDVRRQQLPAWRSSTWAVDSVAVSPDGHYLATAGGGTDAAVRIYDARTRGEVAVLRGHSRGIHAIAFSPDGRLLASGSEDRTLRLWSAETWQPLGVFAGTSEVVRALAFSPDGRYVATGGQGPEKGWPFQARLWEVASRREVAALGQHFGWILSLAFSPDGKTLVVGSGGGDVRLWDVDKRAELPGLVSRGASAAGKGTSRFPHQDNVHGIAFSRDGRMLATCSQDNTVRLWDARTRREIATLLGHDSVVYAVAFSPDGKTLASASNDGTVRLWMLSMLRDNTTPHSLVLRGARESVTSLAFTPDGQALLTGDHAGFAVLWQAPKFMTARASRLAGR